MIDLLLEQREGLALVVELVFVVAVVLVPSYLVCRALPVRLDMAIFGVGTATIAFFAYRLYQSQVDYCKNSYEVETGGDKFSCLEPQHWFANALAVAFFLLIELGLAVMLAAGLVHWWKQRRPKPS